MCWRLKQCADRFSPQGTFLDTTGNDDISDCIKCPAGTFSNTKGSTNFTACLPCASGSYSSYDGASLCETCPAGTSTTQLAARRRAFL